jgi:hypothetical protein
MLSGGETGTKKSWDSLLVEACGVCSDCRGETLKGKSLLVEACGVCIDSKGVALLKVSVIQDRERKTIRRGLLGRRRNVVFRKYTLCIRLCLRFHIDVHIDVCEW